MAAERTNALAELDALIRMRHALGGKTENYQAVRSAVAQVIEAGEDLPDDFGMVEHNPDEGMRLFCCGGDVITRISGPDSVEHQRDCWYVRIRTAIACVMGGTP